MNFNFSPMPFYLTKEFWIVMIKFLALIILFVGGVFIGRWQLHDDMDLLKAQTKLAQAQFEATTNSEALTKVLAAKNISDKLENKLAQAEQTRNQLSKEHSIEIKRLSTGRACLSGDTVRLLNSNPAISQPTKTVHQATSSTDAAHADTASDSTFSSDYDIATWIDSTVQLYDTCKGRLDALIDYEEQTRKEQVK